MTNKNSKTNGRFSAILNSISSIGRRRFSEDPHGARDVDDECHYLKTELLTSALYKMYYDREPVATRVVQVLPLESWCTQPNIYEDEDPETQTPFERAWDALGAGLRGGWYRKEADNPVWEFLRRADVLSGIGHFGALLLGIDDGRPLNEPVEGFEDAEPSNLGTEAQYYVGNDEPEPAPAIETSRRLLYLRVFDESLVYVTRYESDVRNPRYGQPVLYRITLNDPSDQHAGVGLPLNTVDVHWSRVVHIADNLGSSEVFGVPRMRPVFNRLTDLRKMFGASAEMHWRGAFPGLSFETHPQLGGDVRIDIAQARAHIERYFNTLQRYLAIPGVSVKSIAPQFVDPSELIDTHITAICIELGVPKRIFMGSERGELASSQDERAWAVRLEERRHNYLTPRVIVPFIDRLIKIGVLPVPRQYRVEWPETETMQPMERAQVAAARVEAMAKYVQGGLEALMEPMDFLTRELDYEDEEAREILANVVEQLGEEPDEEADVNGESTNPRSKTQPIGAGQNPSEEDEEP